MVSLGPQFYSRTHHLGARFLNERTSEMDDDRHRILDPVLSAENDNSFKPLKTIRHFSIHLTISAAISIIGIVLAACWKESDRCKAYFIMLYLRALFWLITFLFDHVIKHHHETLRMNGYHDFYRSTAVHKSVSFYIVSLWNTVILAIQALMQHYYQEHFFEKCVERFFSPIVYITLFACLETIILGIVHGSYIIRVVQFNKTEQVPDALRGNHCVTGSVGLTQRGADVDELLEKQADLIAYLKDHNLKLNQKLMQLNSQIRHPSIITN